MPEVDRKVEPSDLPAEFETEVLVRAQVDVERGLVVITGLDLEFMTPDGEQIGTATRADGTPGGMATFALRRFEWSYVRPACTACFTWHAPGTACVRKEASL